VSPDRTKETPDPLEPISFGPFLYDPNLKRTFDRGNDMGFSKLRCLGLEYILQKRGGLAHYSELIEAMWPKELRDKRDKTNVQRLLSPVESKLEYKGHSYIQNTPQWGYRFVENRGLLDKIPEPINVAPPESALLDRREFVIDGLGVIADLRYGRCLVSSALRNKGWTGEDERSRLSVEVSLRDHSLDVLSWYLFPLVNQGRDLTDRVALMAGTDDRYDPISPRKFSESGSWVASHYIDAFRTGKIERIEDLGEVKRNDALVLLGSHEVNPKAREYMGDPAKHSPTHQISGKSARAVGYEVELAWAIFTPESAREVTILQTREHKPVVRKTKEHIISCLEGPPLAATPGKSGDRDVWLTDYLLITALPTDATEKRRVISFAGLHRTGTLAAGKLLSEAPQEILNTIHRQLGGHRYFQALIPLEVDNTLSEHGRAQPGLFTDVEVKPIRIKKIVAKK
jgi:DNA-binding winged helix-turn-helix (wHTH) protein